MARYSGILAVQQVTIIVRVSYIADQMIVALIPAHNEEKDVGEAIKSLLHQSHPVDRIIVVADNCTDSTIPIAISMGVEVFEPIRNMSKKAGALNQCLQGLITHIDYVVVLDGDSCLSPNFVERAMEVFSDDVGAVGGIFYPHSTPNFLSFLQGMEYVRYAREIGRNKARARVITGTGAVFRGKALRELYRIRGQVYDTVALTEDNELTLALKHLGWKCVSPKECKVYTDVMLTVSDLWLQRVRWQRGAIENLRAYGITWITLPYIVRQVLTWLGILAVIALAVITVVSALSGTLAFQPLWFSIAVLFWLERIVSVYRFGWKARLVAASLLPEMVYDLVLQAVVVKCYTDVLLRREARWGNVR